MRVVHHHVPSLVREHGGLAVRQEHLREHLNSVSQLDQVADVQRAVDLALSALDQLVDSTLATRLRTHAEEDLY